jgi:two-component system NtrC family sensor kinase
MTAKTPLQNALRWLMPRSLRRQFIFAVAGLALLTLAGGLTAIFALRAATSTSQLLVEERMARMQDAQDLVQHTLLIERESYQLATAESVDAMRASYAGIVNQLEQFDRLVDKIASEVGDDSIAVLDLHQSSQLFRNTANIVAQLRETELQAATKSGRSASKRTPLQPQPGVDGKTSQQFRSELRRQASAMVASAQEQSDHYTRSFLVAWQELPKSSVRNQRWVLLLLIGSLSLAWLVAHSFLGKHVLDRLQSISHCLRQGDIGPGQPVVPVQGNDEIGEMARAVEQFQLDRKQLAQRTTQLEAANKELEAFSYSVSHDLRTPLRAIDGFSHMLLDGYADKLDEEGKRLINVVRSNTQRMAQLIEDILQFSRTGRLEMTLSEIDMSKMAREAFKELQPAGADTRLHFENGQLHFARGDRAMLRQVFMNLLSNAIKFSRSNETPKISLGSSIEGNEAIYYVKDNGVGFNMQYADKLFGVFQRLHSVNEFEGTGIGLAIVKRIIDRHGGRVWAEGRVGEGATFYFTLPCGQA